MPYGEDRRSLTKRYEEDLRGNEHSHRERIKQDLRRYREGKTARASDNLLSFIFSVNSNFSPHRSGLAACLPLWVLETLDRLRSTRQLVVQFAPNLFYRENYNDFGSSSREVIFCPDCCKDKILLIVEEENDKLLEGRDGEYLLASVRNMRENPFSADEIKTILDFVGPYDEACQTYQKQQAINLPSGYFLVNYSWSRLTEMSFDRPKHYNNGSEEYIVKGDVGSVLSSVREIIVRSDETTRFSNFRFFDGEKWQIVRTNGISVG